MHFVQPRPFGGSVSITHVDLVREGEHWRPVRIRSELVSTVRVAPSTRVTQRLAPAHAAVLKLGGSALGEATGPMRAASARLEPTPILNFVQRRAAEATGAELSAASAFDLRAGFDSGTIRMRDSWWRCTPTTTRCARCASAGLSSRSIWSTAPAIIEPIRSGRISINDSMPGYNYDVIAGARYEIDLRRPLGDRIRNLVFRRPPGDADRQLHPRAEQLPPDRSRRILHASRALRWYTTRKRTSATS